VKFSFDTLPLCRPYAKNASYLELGDDWYFKVNGNKVWLPRGYWYNGASIPRPFWSIIGSPFDPDYWAGALAHDWRYLTHTCTRPEADETLFQLLRQAGVGLGRARVIWGAVRSCGYPAWTNNKKDKADLKELRDMVAARPDGGKFFV
jgi:hypothetical protein